MRTVESEASQWSAPDAFEGDAGDPISQRSYIWNRNNPYLYRDPSGYDDECNSSSDGGTTSASGDATSPSTMKTIGCVHTTYPKPHAGGTSAEAPGGTAGHYPTIGRTGIRYKKRPPNAVKCTGGGVSFYAPPNYSVKIPVAAGRKGGFWGLGQVGQFGSLDYQRNGTRASFDFYSDYTPVSNVNVGAYLYGAGLDKGQTDMIGHAYGTLMSSNAGDPNQQKFWNVGWSMANSGGDFSCGR